jgi:hypothetical protein
MSEKTGALRPSKSRGAPVFLTFKWVDGYAFDSHHPCLKSFASYHEEFGELAVTLTLYIVWILLMTPAITQSD